MRSSMMQLIMGGVLLASAHAAAGQGLYWENETTGTNDKVRTAQIYAMPKMMKILTGSSVMIIRGDQDKLYRVDPAHKSYTVLTLADIEATAKTVRNQMQATMEKLQKQASALPPDKRAKLEKMMNDISGSAGEASSSVTVKSTGQTKAISGHACAEYVATANGKTILTAWTAKDIDAFKPLRDDWLVFQKRLMASSPGSAGDVVAAYSKIEGFPMETEMGGMKTVVTKVEPRALTASEFEVPAGYREEKVGLPAAHDK